MGLSNQQMWDEYLKASGGKVNFGGAASWIDRKFGPGASQYSGFLRSKARKRGGDPKRGRRLPVNPLDVQTDSFLAGQLKPYQGLLSDVPGMAQTESAANARLSLGTDKALSGIADSTAASYGTLSKQIADARDASVQNLAQQADFLKNILGGDFAGSGAVVADAQGAADAGQQSSSAALSGASALADIAGSRTANQMMQSEYDREAGFRWDSRKRGLESGIAGISASRPFVRRQLQSQNLDDRLSRLSAELAQKQFKSSEKWKQKEFDEDTRQFDDNLDYKNTEAAYDAISDASDAADKSRTAAEKAAAKAKAERDKKIRDTRKRWENHAGSVQNALFVFDKNGKEIPPKAPFRTAFRRLLTKMPANQAALYAAKWALEHDATGKTFTGSNPNAIYSMLKRLKVDDQVARTIINNAYGASAWDDMTPNSKPRSGRHGNI